MVVDDQESDDQIMRVHYSYRNTCPIRFSHLNKKFRVSMSQWNDKFIDLEDKEPKKDQILNTIN